MFGYLFYFLLACAGLLPGAYINNDYMPLAFQIFKRAAERACAGGEGTSGLILPPRRD